MSQYRKPGEASPSLISPSSKLSLLWGVEVKGRDLPHVADGVPLLDPAVGNWGTGAMVGTTVAICRQDTLTIPSGVVLQLLNLERTPSRNNYLPLVRLWETRQYYQCTPAPPNPLVTVIGMLWFGFNLQYARGERSSHWQFANDLRRRILWHSYFFH